MSRASTSCLLSLDDERRVFENLPAALQSNRNQQADGSRGLAENNRHESVENDAVNQMRERVRIEEELRIMFAIDVTRPDAGYATDAPRTAAHCEFGNGSHREKKQCDS